MKEDEGGRSVQLHGVGWFHSLTHLCVLEPQRKLLHLEVCQSFEPCELGAVSPGYELGVSALVRQQH